MRKYQLLLLAIIAALSFGGSFSCRGEQNSSTMTENPTTGAK